MSENHDQSCLDRSCLGRSCLDRSFPVRMCCACRKRKEKTELIRFVNKDNNIIIDNKYKESGRGAYLCRDKECIKKAKKIKALNRALKANIVDEFYDKIESDLIL